MHRGQKCHAPTAFGKLWTTPGVRLYMPHNNPDPEDIWVISKFGGQSSAVVKRPHCNHKDVGSNPTTARNDNQTLKGPPTEGSPRV